MHHEQQFDRKWLDQYPIFSCFQQHIAIWSKVTWPISNLIMEPVLDGNAIKQRPFISSESMSNLLKIRLPLKSVQWVCAIEDIDSTRGNGHLISSDVEQTMMSISSISKLLRHIWNDLTNNLNRELLGSLPLSKEIQFLEMCTSLPPQASHESQITSSHRLTFPHRSKKQTTHLFCRNQVLMKMHPSSFEDSSLSKQVRAYCSFNLYIGLLSG